MTGVCACCFAALSAAFFTAFFATFFAAFFAAAFDGGLPVGPSPASVAFLGRSGSSVGFVGSMIVGSWDELVGKNGVENM